MYSFKAITLLSTLLLAGVGSARLSTTIGLETDEGSHSVQIPFDDCTQVGQFEVRGVFLSKRCRLFTGVGCTGRNTLLQPGEHTSSEPVYVDSVLCYP
ncbi:hypothetical protein BO83DRAFT_442414 [Aspergillus eucalypticola CBS 122712]|uniref:Uncharacterized protein n=1 Tax=Aspergillus eucalypticola (strain CBS 122712 / IBT 29274) TaxID=1448314 RepID=A0A317UJ85_ASPEC|nr:uncharacterized protein BO83DRAFT_442414 [Aspergillus eucalypticola CBS 122712]PWY61741.1 hypothetical protein BO83DRAFT_442414 [Aspergillus eucalypticola CBS 122712]